MTEHPEERISGRWPRRKRDLGVAIWIAFLAASAGTFVLFAVIDPQDIQAAWMEHWQVGRKLAYGIGFAFLFLVALLASGLSIFMVRTGPRRGHAKGRGARRAPEIRDPEQDNPDLHVEDIK